MKRIKAPAFWWDENPGVGIVLAPFAAVWSAMAARRLRQPPRYHAPMAVICVGNYVVGGAGKTPTVIALARLAREQGLRPGILSRGYGGRAADPVLVDPGFHRALDVGDEALLLAVAAPTVVAGDRVAGAQRLADHGVDLMLLDDGFQDPSVAKDLTVVAVDSAVGVGNGYTLPVGPLRAPLRPQLEKTDVLLVIGDGVAAAPLATAFTRAGKPVLHATLDPVDRSQWTNRRVFAFAGIGRPQKFFDSLTRLGAEVVETRAFADHHTFSQAEARQLLADAAEEDCDLVTTEKDAVRLRGSSGDLARLRDQMAVLAVTLTFADQAAVGETVKAAVRKAAARGAR